MYWNWITGIYNLEDAERVLNEKDIEIDRLRTIIKDHYPQADKLLMRNLWDYLAEGYVARIKETGNKLVFCGEEGVAEKPVVFEIAFGGVVKIHEPHSFKDWNMDMWEKV